MRTLEKIWFGLSLLAFAGMVSAPLLASAQGFYSNSSPSTVGSGPSTVGSGPSTVGGLQNPLGKVTGVCQLLKIVLNVGLLLGTPIAMLFIVWAGFKLVMARGNPTELQKARANLFWTLAGIAIFVGVWTFVQILANTLGSLGVSILGSCS